MTTAPDRALFMTLDLDHAPEYMVEQILALFADRGVPATVFATHDSPALRNAGSLFETGLHPYITNLNQARNAIAQLKRIHPQARCLRSHSLVNSSALLIHAWQAGITATSNYLMLDRNHDRPVPMLYGIHEYPIFFMDDIALMEGLASYAVELPPALRQARGFCVLDFHPVHVYMNATSHQDYSCVKGRLADKAFVDSQVQRRKPGVADLLLSLLDDPELAVRFSLFPESPAAATRLAGGYRA